MFSQYLAIAIKVATVLIISGTTLSESKLVEDSSTLSLPKKEDVPKGCADRLSVECRDRILSILCEGTDVPINDKDVAIPCCIDFVVNFSEICKKSSVIYDDNVKCKNKQSAVGKVAFVVNYCTSLLEG